MYEEHDDLSTTRFIAHRFQVINMLASLVRLGVWGYNEDGNDTLTSQKVDNYVIKMLRYR
jgi:hypothetical protein